MEQPDYTKQAIDYVTDNVNTYVNEFKQEYPNFDMDVYKLGFLDCSLKIKEVTIKLREDYIKRLLIEIEEKEKLLESLKQS